MAETFAKSIFRKCLHMKILCPITSECDIQYLQPRENNVEFFCGYIPDWWIKKYNDSEAFHMVGNMSTPINNRNGLKANFTEQEDLQKASAQADSYSTDMFLALNAKYYPEYVYNDLEEYICEVSEAGIRKMIVCDLGMVSYLSVNHPEIKVSVSCLNQVTNSMAVSFYSHFTNVERIVFPRHMSVKEICHIAEKNPQIDYEYFIFSNKCLYDDGFCRGVHEFTPICKDLYISEYCLKSGVPLFDAKVQKLRENETIYRSWTHNEVLAEAKGYCMPSFGCTACSLPELIKYPNIKSVKLSIRGHGVEERLRQVKLAHSAIQCAVQDGTQGDIECIISTGYGNPDLCRLGMSCIMR